jgi:hypothetical protein
MDVALMNAHIGTQLSRLRIRDEDKFHRARIDAAVSYEKMLAYESGSEGISLSALVSFLASLNEDFMKFYRDVTAECARGRALPSND